MNHEETSSNRVPVCRTIQYNQL